LVDKPRFSNKAFVAIVPDGRVLGERALISPDHKLLWDVSVEWAKMPPEHSIFQEQKMPPLIRTDKTVALLNHPASKNYYHWLLEAIARIHLLQKVKIKIDKYIVNHRSLPFQIKTLAACGIPAEKIIQPHDRFHLQAHKLIVPSYVNLPNSWSCKYVRNLLLPHMAFHNEVGYERIYIRRKASRRVVNEHEIIGLLEKYGFKVVELESLPLDRQIRLFYSATIIVAPHGAGLANLVFCQPNTRVIELFTPSFMEPHYWLISRLMRLNYHMIVGNRENPHHYWAGFDDLSIDPNQLKEVLSCLLS
jgi:capsular polysaccharide biosynthesis protein